MQCTVTVVDRGLMANGVINYDRKILPDKISKTKNDADHFFT
jgi:hypothetical protein